MFDRRAPCSNCPFRVGKGSRFRLSAARLEEIRRATAFQCHKTVDYGDEMSAQGDRPQQCAGLMTVLLREDAPNTIMQVALRFGALDAERLDGTAAYVSWEEVRRAHERGLEPSARCRRCAPSMPDREDER
jgi:hypothetical protein